MHPEFKFRDRNIEFNSSGHVVSNLTTPLITTAATSGSHANPAPAAQKDKPPTEAQQEPKPTKAVEQSIPEEKETAEEEAKDPEPTPEKAKPLLEEALTEPPSGAKLQDDPSAGGVTRGSPGVDLESSLNSSSVEKGLEANTSMDFTTVPPLSLPAQQTDKTLTVSAEERRLLFRVNWLLQRFRDSASRDLRIEHTQKSLDLLMEVPNPPSH